MKTAKLFLSPLRRAKSRRDGTLLTVCDSLRTFSLRTFSLRAILLPVLAFFFCADLHAQVLIGGTDRPKNGAILDLNSTAKGGLLLSNVTLPNLYTIPAGFPGITDPGDVTATVKEKFTGAMVYHKGGNDIPVGIYVWNGTNWTSMEENCKSPALTLSAPLFIKQGATVSFSVSSDASPRCAAGETYEWFRAVSSGGTASSSFGSGAGASTSFTATGSYKIRVVATSPYSSVPVEKEVTVSVTADGGPDPATLSNTYGIVGATCLDVKKSTQGKTLAVFDAREDGFPGNNYAKTYKFVHGNNYSDLVLSLDDPDHLVAAITPPPASVTSGIGGEKEFTVTFKPEVRELAAATPLTVKLYASYKPQGDPATRYAYLEIRVEDGTCICPAKINTSPETWLNFMCHNLGALDIISPSQLITREHHGDWYRFGAKQVSMKNTPAHDTDNIWDSPDYYTSSGDWPADSIPCPAGWRLPTRDEWNDVKTTSNNINTNVPVLLTYNSDAELFSHLKKVGDNLMLPFAAYRHATTSTLTYRGYRGYYWSSMANGNSNGDYMGFADGAPFVSNSARGSGMSVRCVQAE